MSSPAVFFLLNSWAVLGPLHFHIDFRISMSVATEKLASVLIAFILTAY